MDFKSIRDKTAEKISKTDFQAAAAKVVKKVDEAVEKAKEPKTNKQIVTQGVIGVAVAVTFGGALVPALAIAAVEGVVAKKWSDRTAAKKAADAEENGQANDRPAAPQPKSPQAPKSGPKPS